MMVGECEPPTLKNNGRKKKEIRTQNLIRSNQRKDGSQKTRRRFTILQYPTITLAKLQIICYNKTENIILWEIENA